jgi:toxin HigB-1
VKSQTPALSRAGVRQPGGRSGIERPARLKLDRLEAATTIGDLAALPGNRFENLKGDRKGQCSIRINDKWRICFEWPAGSPGPISVEIVDYH